MSGHIVPLRVYFLVFITLMLLSALTVWAAFQDFGTMNTVVALVIAVIKATLVILFFMHVKYSSNLVKVAAAAGFIWLLILIAFTVGDVASRGWIPVGGWN